MLLADSRFLSASRFGMTSIFGAVNVDYGGWRPDFGVLELI
jgi:hypothetical protein